VTSSVDPGRATVLVVEDHELVAEALRTALDARGVVTSTVTPCSAASVVEAAARLRPRVALLDLELGHPVGDGVALVAPLVELGCQVLVVTGSTDRARIAGALEAGAVGYRPKSGSLHDLLDAVSRVLAGEPVTTDAQRFELMAALRRHRTAQRERRAPFERLSPVEQDVLHALAEGLSVDEIAAHRRVATSTVRSQVRGILTKLGVGSQLAAVARARAAGWPMAGSEGSRRESPSGARDG